MKKKNKNFTLAFIFIVAIILTITIVLLMVTNYIFLYLNLDAIADEDFEVLIYFITVIVSSLVIGIGLSFIASRFFINPINKLVNGLQDLSNGLYSIRLSFGKYTFMKDLSDNFNTLAKELENNEFIHNDFINNFSHEFKTPISSITGLISLLKKKNLPEEKKQEYLSIIEEEAERLLTLTSNILMLSKVDNKNILSNIEKYNLSEQIRNCIVLYEKKWDKKRLNLCLDFDEFYISGDEYLLKQVWLNLIDNAIKFADKKTDLKISINKENNYLVVYIENIGVEIKEEEKEKIFNKFYQSDSSHSKEGNGIGLSIVKSIVELHKGNISVESKDKHTIFKVKLPL